MSSPGKPAAAGRPRRAPPPALSPPRTATATPPASRRAATPPAGFNVAGVYTIDAMFVTDAAKLLSGNLAALSAMVHLELPHVNVSPAQRARPRARRCPAA